MSQATMTKPSSSAKSTYDPYASMEGQDASASSYQADSVPAEPQYKLVIDENVVEKISSKAAQKIDGIIDMKGNLLSRVQEGLGGNVLEYGKSATDVFDQIKKVVGQDIKDMTGLNVIEMTVNVVDVMTQDEYDQKNGNNTDDGQSGYSNDQ